MLRSTFLGFKTANSALRVNQNLLDVVGQNMSNVNTKGYTRQRLDINTVSFSTNNLKYGANGVIIGQGVAAAGISQYRDSFLDLRYRTEAAKSGTESVQLDALSDLESVFDEISMDGLDAQFSDLVSQLQSLTSSPSDPVIEGVVRTSASMLCQMFNDYSERINTVKEQQTSYLKDGAIVEVNQLMKNIAGLNKQIKEDNISGNPALELNDERNMLIDELSSYLDVEVNLTPLSIGGGRTIDELSIKLKGNGMKLVNDDEFAELEVVKVIVETVEKGVKINLKKSIDDTTLFPTGKDLTQSIDKGQIAGYINFLNGKGEFATSGSTDVKGVQYYESMLDTLASKFADLMNEANKNLKVDIDGNPLKADGTKAALPTEYVYQDRPLFEPRTGTGITARNIKISNDWSDASGSYITNTKVPSAAGDVTGATENILKMISLFQDSHDFKTPETTDGTTTTAGKPLFTGTMQEFFSYSATNLSLQVADAQNSYDTYSGTQYQIDYSRRSMSSVDLDEEGVNLLTYSKSYNAAARLMTTLDEMLDTLINRMAV